MTQGAWRRRVALAAAVAAWSPSARAEDPLTCDLVVDMVGLIPLDEVVAAVEGPRPLQRGILKCLEKAGAPPPVLDAVRRREGRGAAEAEADALVDYGDPGWPEAVGRGLADRTVLAVGEPGAMALLVDRSGQQALDPQRFADAYWYFELADRVAAALLEGLPQGSAGADEEAILSTDAFGLLEADQRLDRETRLLRLGFKRVVLLRETVDEAGAVVLELTVRTTEDGSARTLSRVLQPPQGVGATAPVAESTPAEPAPPDAPAPDPEPVPTRAASSKEAARWEGALLYGLTNVPSLESELRTVLASTDHGGRASALVGSGFLWVAGPLGRRAGDTGPWARVDLEQRVFHQPDSPAYRALVGADPLDPPLAVTTTETRATAGFGWGGRLGIGRIEATLGPTLGVDGNAPATINALLDRYTVTLCADGAMSLGGTLRVRGGADLADVVHLGAEVMVRLDEQLTTFHDFERCGYVSETDKDYLRAVDRFRNKGVDTRLRAVGRLVAPITGRVSLTVQGGVEAAFYREVIPVENATDADLAGISDEEEELGWIWVGADSDWIPVAMLGLLIRF